MTASTSRRHRRVPLAATALLACSLVLAASPAGAQPVVDLDLRLIEELAGIHDTLDRIVTLLEGGPGRRVDRGP